MMDDAGKVALGGGTGDMSADKPIFDPQDWRLSDFEAALCAETRRLAQAKFAPAFGNHRPRGPFSDRKLRRPSRQ